MRSLHTDYSWGPADTTIGIPWALKQAVKEIAKEDYKKLRDVSIEAYSAWIEMHQICVLYNEVLEACTNDEGCLFTTIEMAFEEKYGGGFGVYILVDDVTLFKSPQSIATREQWLEFKSRYVDEEET